MAAGTFGRKGSDDAEMARRRAAFIAAERARAAELALQPAAERSFGAAAATPVGRPAPAAGASGPVFVAEKSIGAAYLFWFFFGAAGGHRFYLGYPVSGVIQFAVWIVSWSLLMTGFVPAIGLLVLVAIGVIVDAFLIPHLCSKKNAELRSRATAYAFA
jgi:TM2 domain-containing membrane protein YozV